VFQIKVKVKNAENTNHRMTWWRVWTSLAAVPNGARCRGTPGKSLPASVPAPITDDNYIAK